MEIKFGGRASGKTTRMLKELDGREDAILLVYKQEVGDHLMKVAEKLGYKLVHRPISWSNPRDMDRAKGKKVYVDDGRVLFERMFKGLDVEMVNFTVEMM